MIKASTDPKLDDSPVKVENSETFERNFSGQRGVRSVPITVKDKNGTSKSLNPFLEDVGQGEVTELDSCACDVSTQTELTVNKKENCKLM